ncbi:MAG: RNA polymerase sigma factor, partial [Phycisphaerae bacterium]
MSQDGQATSDVQPLLPRVAAGATGAVEDCIRRYGPMVWGLSRKFCRNHAEAEDASQDIFIELWKSAARYDPAAAGEPTFVITIARRRLIDRLRRKSRRRADPVHAAEPLEDRAVGVEGTQSRVDDADEASRARVALRQLSDDQQRVLTLAIDEGCSYPDIAEALNMPLGTVKTHARRGLIRLRELLSAGTPGTPGT